MPHLVPIALKRSLEAEAPRFPFDVPALASMPCSPLYDTAEIRPNRKTEALFARR